MTQRNLLFVVLTALLFVLCPVEARVAEKKSYITSIKDVPVSNWKILAEKRIYFGHQSVGYNIIEGMNEVMKDNIQVRLNINKMTSSAPSFQTPAFVHSDIGKNGDPSSKVDDFAKVLGTKGNDQANFAMFKFCYVDFDRTTEVNRIFEYYRTSMAQLKRTHPKTRFIHVTVPLVSMNVGLKDLVKKILGRSIKDPDVNVKRNRFNDLLRKEYEGKELIFDLAGIESTYPDGRRASFTHDGKSYYSMVPKYTDDGGHLNESGRRIVAEQFLVFLATSLK